MNYSRTQEEEQDYLDRHSFPLPPTPPPRVTMHDDLVLCAWFFGIVLVALVVGTLLAS